MHVAVQGGCGRGTERPRDDVRPHVERSTKSQLRPAMAAGSTRIWATRVWARSTLPSLLVLCFWLMVKCFGFLTGMHLLSRRLLNALFANIIAFFHSNLFHFHGTTLGSP